jgi:RNA polymerase sigma-B factor
VSIQGLSEVETRELMRAYHERGDRAARDRLIEQHLPLVRALARRYAGRSEQLDDLIQVGSIGLIKAIDRFELDRGVELTTYAIPTIIGELKRHFRDRGWAVHVPRRLKELSLQLNQLVEELGGKLGRSPTVAELATASGTDEEEVIEALDIGHVYSALSLSSTTGESDELDPLGSLGAPDEGFETSEDRTFLSPGFEALDPRARKIMHLRFYAGLTQSQIAQEVGISQMHVSRLIRRSLVKMRAGMAGEPQERLADEEGVE